MTGKEVISQAIIEAKEARGVSYRTLANECGLLHPAVHRIVRGDNYTIDVLLKVLDVLELEIAVRPKVKARNHDELWLMEDDHFD
ncbi:hypothetical protein D3C81_2073970 [compost metagenome]